MRTNIHLDEALVAQAMAKAGVRTKKAAVEAALRAYVREPDWDFIVSMEGSDAVADDYNPAGLFDRDPLAVRAVRRPPAAGRKAAPRR